MSPRNLLAALSGAVIGALGGLIGLGGAEFRLPLLVGLFGYGVLDAIVVNLSISLVTVVTSFRGYRRAFAARCLTAHAASSAPEHESAARGMSGFPHPGPLPEGEGD